LKNLAPRVWRLKEFPLPSINVYLAEDVLIDAGRTWDRRRIFAEIEGRQISMLALTHVHPDHQGVAKDVCEARRIPLTCHPADVDAMEGRRPVAASSHPIARVSGRIWAGPPHPVEKTFSEGDEVAGFRVVHAPGHSPGEVIFFRDSDRVAICGDVIRSMSYATGRPLIAEPPEFFNTDSAENRRSIRKLADLEPSLILPGHGPAVTNIAAFERFVARLPG
jgi:hydroxyacylglutathione hydrolase